MRVSKALPAWQRYTIEKIFPAREPYQPVPPVNVAMFSEEVVAPFLAPVEFHEHRTYSLTNVHVTWNGAVFNNLRLFVPSLVHDWYEPSFQDTLLLRQWVGRKVTAPAKSVAVCHNQWSVENYYHWLADTLPRLLVLRQTHPNITLVLPQPLPPKQLPDYIRLSAAALGFTDYLPVNPRQVLRADTVVVPELTATPISQNPELIRQVRAELLTAYRPAPAPATRRIFAARAATGVRKLINEAEVDALLSEYGFEKVYFEHYSFLEQIKLMHETKVLLGVHGAGMTNMFFLQDDAKVIELLNQEHQVHCYYWLASCFGLPYFLAPCAGTNPAKTSHSDMVVDIATLKQVLDVALD